MRAVLILAAFMVTCGPALAQAPNCLFPLACPGPTPPKPEPLYGPPEDQTAEPAAQPVKARRHVRKHVVKTKTQ